VGGWSPTCAAWPDGVDDPVAAILAGGGRAARLDDDRAEAIAVEDLRLRFGVDGRSVHEAGGDAVDELAAVLAQTAAWLRVAERRGRPLTDVFAHLDVEVAIGREPLVEIAKLRALRGALAAMAAACGASREGVSSRVVGHGSHREFTRRDPWVNLLRGTMAGIAGVLGGVDALEIPPLDLLEAEHGEFGARMAIDTHRLLRDEAHLAVTADATAGSHAIEAATEALADAAWRRFREIEAAGGFDAWLAAGQLHSATSARARSLAARVKAGDLVLLGSNLHPPRDVHEVPRGGWTMPATSRVTAARTEGDVRPLVWISLEALLTDTPSADVPASGHGDA
jgi:methylmalonyl-CoA mutase